MDSPPTREGLTFQCTVAVSHAKCRCLCGPQDCPEEGPAREALGAENHDARDNERNGNRGHSKDERCLG